MRRALFPALIFLTGSIAALLPAKANTATTYLDCYESGRSIPTWQITLNENSSTVSLVAKGGMSYATRAGFNNLLVHWTYVATKGSASIRTIGSLNRMDGTLNLRGITGSGKTKDWTAQCLPSKGSDERMF